MFAELISNTMQFKLSRDCFHLFSKIEHSLTITVTYCKTGNTYKIGLLDELQNRHTYNKVH